MVHYRNEHADDALLDSKIVSEFEGKYQEILEKAKEEYILYEPSPYYRDGYNLYLRMQNEGANYKQYSRTLFKRL